MCMYTSMHKYIHTYIYIYICTHVYTYIHKYILPTYTIKQKSNAPAGHWDSGCAQLRSAKESFVLIPMAEQIMPMANIYFSRPPELLKLVESYNC